jgi:transcriptional regulator with XRE-family HTH domain
MTAVKSSMSSCLVAYEIDRCLLTPVMSAMHTARVPYRTHASAPRGRWARWLHRMRKDRGLSQTQAFEALREDLNLGPRSRASYRAIDMGDRPPTPREAEVLVRYFGSSPDDLPEITEDTETPASLVDAIKVQTGALLALVEELRLARVGSSDDAELAEGQEAGQEAAAALRLIEDNESRAKPPVPRGTRE